MTKIAPYERIDYEDLETGLVVITDKRNDWVSVKISDYGTSPTSMIAHGHRDTGWLIRVLADRVRVPPK